MAINHTGYLDFTFAGLGARSRPSGWSASWPRTRSSQHPVAGPLMRGHEAHPASTATPARRRYAAAVTALQDGEIVGVFPEATMSPSFELLPFKQGAARMAIEAGVPLLPTIIWGSQRVDHLRPPQAADPAPLPDHDHGRRAADGRGRRGRGRGTRRLREVMTEMLHHAQDTYPDSPPARTTRWWLPARLGGTAPDARGGPGSIVNAAAQEGEAAAETSPGLPTGPAGRVCG